MCHKHQWIVYSTALCPPTIMVYCQQCYERGSIEYFNSIEWDKAFYAPSDNYPWLDESRVKICASAVKNS